MPRSSCRALLSRSGPLEQGQDLRPARGGRGRGGQSFEDVVIDGVTAYDTTQWAGILVNGAVWGDNKVRARDVTIRNSIVHDVYGDGIVLFQVEDGLIEKSAAWRYRAPATGDDRHSQRDLDLALPPLHG